MKGVPRKNPKDGCWSLKMATVSLENREQGGVLFENRKSHCESRDQSDRLVP